MLLRDRRLAALPALAEVVQVRQNRAAQHRLETERAEQRVERLVGARLREGVERAAELPTQDLELVGSGLERGFVGGRT